jgi:hypothetical protein
MGSSRSRWWFALRARAAALRGRHARAFWIAHSVWALAQGVAVAVLAENRPEFWAWVLGFLALTWGSTLLFCRAELVRRRPASLRVGVASYATRVIHQETLFFLLPFYVRSTTLDSWNVAFTIALAALALLACLDLTFDRWLRRSAAFAATFFFAVAYAALQLLLPLVGRVPFGIAQQLALALALASAVALVGLPRGPRRRERLLGALPAAALTLALLAAPLAVPPAPLRIAAFEFEELAASVRATARVAAPVPLPVHVTIEWSRARQPLRSSRDVSITAHGAGFRVWDELARARLAGGEGDVLVEVLTETGQLLGRGTLARAAGG